MRRSPLARAFWLLAALLQLTLPGATAWADARLEREARSPRSASHIEAHHSADCPRTHPPDCGLCQHLATLFIRATPPRFEAASPRQHAPRPAASQRAARPAPFALALSRAPPLS
jgi:hypothetical protein